MNVPFVVSFNSFVNSRFMGQFFRLSKSFKNNWIHVNFSKFHLDTSIDCFMNLMPNQFDLLTI